MAPSARPRRARRSARSTRSTRALADGRARRGSSTTSVGALGWQLPRRRSRTSVVDALLDALRAGADEEQLGRAIAYAAALRIARFHVQNDHGDWDTVHHSFTAANALHHALQRSPTPELLRGAVHAALRDQPRPLPQRARRRACPQATSGSLDALAHCFDVQGMVDDAGNEAYGFLQRRRHARRAGRRARARAARRGRRSSTGTRRSKPASARRSSGPRAPRRRRSCSPAVARFLAAHTPTRRELPTVVRIATRLRRGEALYEEATITE